jgi:ATP-dependent helicase YprA (DUF1998 family)
MPVSAQHSVDILKNAQELASTQDNYNSQVTRLAIVKRCEDAFGGNKPYDWQIDVTEALLLGLDCVAIAGTGAGKTMPFGLPLLMDESKRKIVIVISPLNDLEVEQVSIISLSEFLIKS